MRANPMRNLDMNRALHLTLVCLTATATAQQSQLANQDETHPTRSAKTAASFSVPIHTQQADPIGGEYGTWAAGDDYKVSFHDDMTFYPAIAGVDGRVTWRTTSIQVGNEELLSGAAPLRHNDDWRYEYRYGQITEAYDVRIDGVEQTFVFASIPGQGDLVVTGQVLSPLEVQPMSGHGAIVFCDQQGHSIVEYGAATVFDAAGRTLQIETTASAGEVRLRVPAAWLANATAPITIDPIISTTTVKNSSGYPVDIDIARDDESNQLLIAYGRWSGNENDLFIVLCDEDFSNSTVVYSDISTSWKTSQTALAFIGGGDKWVMSFTRRFASGMRAVRYRFHPKGLKQLQTNYKALAQPGGFPTDTSDIGGTAAFSTGTKALIVFEADPTLHGFGSSETDVWGSLLDASTETAAPAFLLSKLGPSLATSRDRHDPTVNPESDGGPASWIVAWQERNLTITNDDLDVYAARVNTSGAGTDPIIMAQKTASRHSTLPLIAGRGGRYLLAFGDHPNGSLAGQNKTHNIYVQRFDWAENAIAPARQTPRAIRTNPNIHYIPRSVTYDQENRSHWLVITQGTTPNQIVFADLVGHAGGVVEAMMVSPVAANTDFSPAAVYNDDTNDFAIIHGGLDKKVYGYIYTRNTAKSSTYGIACGPGSIHAVGLPHSGTEFYTLRLQGTAPNTNAFLALALAPSTINLDFIGLTGCFANTSPNLALTTIPFVTGPVNGDVQLPLPAPISADVYTQFIYMNPGANPLGIEATKGMKVEIR